MRSDRKYKDAAATQWTWGLEPRHILVFGQLDLHAARQRVRVPGILAVMA